MKKKTNKPGTSAEKPAELPDWVTDTPYQIEFQLAAVEAGSVIEFIEVDRSEYIALKLHLAMLRGIPIAACKDEFRRQLNDPGNSVLEELLAECGTCQYEQGRIGRCERTT